jgi:hypothetical protein
MKQRQLWLLAVLSIFVVMTVFGTATAEQYVSGQVEIGVAGMNTEDSPARVNEYVRTRSEDGFSFAPKLFLDSFGDNSSFRLDADIMGPRDQQYNLKVDSQRILRLDVDYQVLEHWKDRETLDQMGATGRGDTLGGQPSVTTDEIFADLIDAGLPANVGGGTINYDPREAHEQELSNNYIVTRREFKGDIDVTLPSMPNVTFHTGWRSETRQGMEQAIGVTKCDNCHVTASGKAIDELTEDLRFGATGRFGKVTMEYDYLQRTFTEDAAAPDRYYETVGNGTGFNLLYPEWNTDTLTGPGGRYDYARTPDSEKDSHSLKGRIDFSAATTLSGSYQKSEVESSKSDTQGEYELLGGDKLTTDFESFGARLAHRFANGLRLSLRGSSYEITADDNVIIFDAREGVAAWPGDVDENWHTAVTREVNELGADLVYRLTPGTTARLGYTYEEIDREEEHLGQTETHAIKLALKSRINRTLSGRVSYEYQTIDEPLAGAPVGIAQEDVAGGAIQDLTGDPNLWYYLTGDFNAGDATIPTWYWSAVYPNRQLESTSQPEDIHEVKFSSTWAPKANLAATLFARVRLEENDRVKYEKTTYVPGLSIWFAPTGKMNLTMAYTFNKQETENQMCVGWYHG